MKYSSKKDTSFWKLVRSFLHEYMPVIRNLSKSTVSTYKDSLQMLLDFLKEEKNIKDGQVTFEVFKSDGIVVKDSQFSNILNIVVNSEVSNKSEISVIVLYVDGLIVRAYLYSSTPSTLVSAMDLISQST